MTTQINPELEAKLKKLVKVAVALELYDELDRVFRVLTGQDHEKWDLAAWNVSDGTYPEGSEKRQQHLHAYQPLIDALKVVLHTAIDAV